MHRLPKLPSASHPMTRVHRHFCPTAADTAQVAPSLVAYPLPPPPKMAPKRRSVEEQVQYMYQRADAANLRADYKVICQVAKNNSHAIRAVITCLGSLACGTRRPQRRRPRSRRCMRPPLARCRRFCAAAVCHHRRWRRRRGGRWRGLAIGSSRPLRGHSSGGLAGQGVDRHRPPQRLNLGHDPCRLLKVLAVASGTDCVLGEQLARPPQPGSKGDPKERLAAARRVRVRLGHRHPGRRG